VSIDATDMDNELAAAEYIDDIYKFYKETEVMLYAFFLCLSLCSLFPMHFLYVDVFDFDETGRGLCA